MRMCIKNISLLLVAITLVISSVSHAGVDTESLKKFLEETMTK